MSTLSLNISELFGDQQSYYLNMMRDRDRITIWAGKYVTINLNLVTFIVEGENEITFYFVNRTKISVRKSGEILYVPNDSAVIVSEEEE